jgi:anti-sigma regulatory factor (Ser/Thr protein kinase)
MNGQASASKAKGKRSAAQRFDPEDPTRMLSSSDLRRDARSDVSDAARGFHHQTLFYAGEAGFLRGTLPFIAEAVAAGEPVRVAVGSTGIALLRDALGVDAKRVSFADVSVLGRNPARLIPAWHQFLEEHEGHPVRGVSESIWPGRSPAELTECERHESLMNLAFDGERRWRLLCLYDVDGLGEQAIEAARRSHPFIAHDGGYFRSEAYLGEGDAPGPFDGPLPPPASNPAEVSFTGADLTPVRRRVREWAAGRQLDDERAERLVLAVNELATNSVRHGGGAGLLLMWTEGETVMCEVRDAGRIEEPLVGLRRPSPDRPSGRGLWLVNQVCDLVQIRSAHSGTAVRIHLRSV